MVRSSISLPFTIKCEHLAHKVRISLMKHIKEDGIQLEKKKKKRKKEEKERKERLYPKVSSEESYLSQKKNSPSKNSSRRFMASNKHCHQVIP